MSARLFRLELEKRLEAEIASLGSGVLGGDLTHENYKHNTGKLQALQQVLVSLPDIEKKVTEQQGGG